VRDIETKIHVLTKLLPNDDPKHIAAKIDNSIKKLKKKQWRTTDVIFTHNDVVYMRMWKKEK